MSLKYTILGLLIDKPVHGYGLKEAMAPALRRERQINDGVLYPLLAKMEKEGLVRSRVEKSDKRPDRRVLHPTAKGRRVFFEWLRGPAFEEDQVTYDFFLGHPFLGKCVFFKHLTREEIHTKLMAQKESALAKLEAFNRIREGMVERGVDPFRIAILDLGIAQHREKIRWLEEMTEKPPQGSTTGRPRRKACSRVC
jgi:DNA-binding PadR family transcriptional regulator